MRTSFIALVLAIASLAACKRPRSTPNEAGAEVPTPDPIRLEVTELPVVDVGPPPLHPDLPLSRTEPISVGAARTLPTQDDGFILFEPWFPLPGDDGGRVDVRSFDAAGHERWRLTLAGDPPVSYVRGIGMVVDGDTAWFAVGLNGTLVFGGERIEATTGVDTPELVLVRLDVTTGRVRGHTSFRARGGVTAGPMTAMGDGVLLLLRADPDNPASHWLSPGYEGHLIRLDRSGTVVWKVGAAEWRQDAQLSVDVTRILLTFHGTISARVGDRVMASPSGLLAWSAIVSMDGRVLDLQPHTAGNAFRVSYLCPEGICYTVTSSAGQDPTDTEPEPLPPPYFDDAGRYHLPSPPKWTIALIVEDTNGTHFFEIPKDDCGDPLAVIPEGVLILCENTVQLRSLDGRVLAESPARVSAENFLRRADGRLLLVSRDWSKREDVHRYTIKLSSGTALAAPAVAP